MAKVVDEMSVKELKTFIEEHGLEFSDCVEKHHLQVRAHEAAKFEAVPVAKQSEPPKPASEAAPKQNRAAAQPKDDLYCTTCKKKFQSKPKMKEHLKSKKHKDAAKAAAAPKSKSATKKQEQKPKPEKSRPVPSFSEPEDIARSRELDQVAEPVPQSNTTVSASEVESNSEEFDSASAGSESDEPKAPAEQELTPEEAKRAAIEGAVTAARIAQALEKISEQDSKITRAANDADLSSLSLHDKTDKSLSRAQRSAAMQGDKSLTVSANQIGSRSSFVKSFLKP